jgi:hypothetical protein
MKIVRQQVILCVFILVAFVGELASAQQAPAVPYIEKGVCPFEGCQYGRWITRSPLKVYPREGDTSQVAFTIAPGDSFFALTGNIHMDRLGVVVVTKPLAQFSPGDTIYTLSYTGESYINIWFRGQQLNIEIFWPTDDDIDFATINLNDPRWKDFPALMVTRPLMVWWVQIAYRNGQTGWLRLVNNTIAGFHINEEIDGMDALG